MERKAETNSDNNSKQFPKKIQLDEAKLAELPTTNQLLEEKFGVDGTPEREEFNARAIAWYYDSSECMD